MLVVAYILLYFFFGRFEGWIYKARDCAIVTPYLTYGTIYLLAILAISWITPMQANALCLEDKNLDEQIIQYLLLRVRSDYSTLLFVPAQHFQPTVRKEVHCR